MAATQEHRTIRLSSPLGAQTLLFVELDASEQLSAPFAIELVLFSERGDLDPDRILGQPVSIVATLPAPGRTRYFHGLVTEFAQTDSSGRYYRYRASLRPWFWFLTRTADCRIFQNLTVPQIFEQVVKQYRFTDYRLKLRGSYPSWEYCVQYRETDFNFLSRLLEQEGIYYYFEHEENSHQMVLVDDPSAHGKIPGYESVPYQLADALGSPVRDRLSSFLISSSVQTGVFASTDYDFEQPKLSLAGKSTISAPYARSGLEVFDYPADLQKNASSETERIAKIRIEELQARRCIARGSGNAAGLAAGYVFGLERFPRAAANIDYLVIATQLSIASDEYASTANFEKRDWAISIEAIDARIPFRPARTAHKPLIQGAQTAVVVGQAGEEIYTDTYGRVKVQFPWDRYGKADESSSCWVRVAQFWAGKSWGAIHVPRIGQEVLVSFLEGDPDRPIITGRVYNADEMPPYTLPGNATQSGVKSSSSKGNGSNELRFEDKAGNEQVYLHAQKDSSVVVENDATTDIHHDRTETVGNNETLTVTKDRTRTVNGKEAVQIAQDQSIDVGTTYTLTAGQQITLKTGLAKIVLNSSGDISIEGLNVTVSGQTSATVKSSMTVSINGTASTSVEGTMLSLSGDATVQMTGGMIMIG